MEAFRRVKDVFISLLQRIRYSDAYNLKRSDVKEDFFEITTVKTGDSLVIELNKNTKEILDKYKENPFSEK